MGKGELEMIDSPILITGAARSGTSITAAMIHYGGAFGGSVMLPDRERQGPMLENLHIRSNVIRPYLSELGVDPSGQHPLLNLKDIGVWDRLAEDGRNEWADRIKQVMINQGYKGGQWFYKCPKMALMWPLWYHAFPEARWIIVHRDREEIANSCLRMPFMRAYKSKEEWMKWVDRHTECFEEMGNESNLAVRKGGKPLNIQHTYPKKMIDGDFSEMKCIVEELGLQWDEDKARALINPKSWRRDDGQ